MPGKSDYSKNPSLFPGWEDDAAKTEGGVTNNTANTTTSNAANNTATTTNTTTNTATTATNGDGDGEKTDKTPKMTAYDDTIKYLEEQIKQHEAAQRAVRNQSRSLKWERIISGISDAVSSISNLYFTSKGAPNMFDPSSSLSAKGKERFDKAREQQEKLREQNDALRLKVAELKDKKEQVAYERKKDEDKAKQDAKKAEQSQTNWQAAFDQKERHHEEDVAMKKAGQEATAAHNKAMEDIASKRANAAAASSGGNKQKYKLGTKIYTNKEEWQKDIRKYIEDNGLEVPMEETVVEGTSTSGRKKTDTRRVIRKPTTNDARLAAIVERHMREQAAKQKEQAAKKKKHADLGI